MRIGELSERSRVSVRMLRYYEERGLLSPQREANGYRQYSDDDVARAGLVSSLIRSGLPTKLIIPLLRNEQDEPDPPGSGEDLFQLLTEELSRLDSKIACMSLSRDTIQRYVRRMDTSRRPARSDPQGTSAAWPS